MGNALLKPPQASGRSARRRPGTKAEERSAPSPRLELRPYQQQADDALRDLDRAFLGWHRRAGKDIFTLDLAARRAEEQVGSYWHLYPTHVQARRAIWNGIDARAGLKFLDRAFPKSSRSSTRSQDMTINLKSGSAWQLCGSDRYDSLVGSNPKGVVFSEWALCDPRAWEYIRPILRENGGWAIFITTFRGRNHAWRMAKAMANNPRWYVDIRSILDTTDVDGNPILTEADIQEEREDGMSEALIRQEFYCDPIAAQPGSVYGRAVERLIELGRMGAYPYDSSRPVFASWSLCPSQHTVTFFQTRGSENRIIGCKSYPFESLPDVLDLVQHSFPWKYIARHILPHDADSDDIAVFEDTGRVVELGSEKDNIFSATRSALGNLYIDTDARAWTDGEENNQLLVDALNGYRFSEATGGQSYTNSPIRSWEMHYAKTLETFAAWREDFGEEADGWHPPPSMAVHDRRVI